MCVAIMVFLRVAEIICKNPQSRISKFEANSDKSKSQFRKFKTLNSNDLDWNLAWFEHLDLFRISSFEFFVQLDLERIFFAEPAHQSGLRPFVQRLSEINQVILLLDCFVHRHGAVRLQRFAADEVK